MCFGFEKSKYKNILVMDGDLQQDNWYFKTFESLWK